MVEETERPPLPADSNQFSPGQIRAGLRKFVSSVAVSAKLLLTRDIDTTTEDGRGSMRLRNSLLTSGSSVLTRGVQVVVSLITVPIALHHLHLERYGLLATVSSMAGMLVFSDLGIGNSLINMIARSQSDDGTDQIHTSVSTAFYLLLGVALLLIGVASAVVYGGLNVAHLLNLKSPEAIAEVNAAVVTFVCCFSLNMPFGIVQKTQLGLQRGYYANNWLTVGSLATIPVMLLSVKMNLGVSAFVFATLGTQLLANIMNHIWYFMKHVNLAPRVRDVKLAIGAKLISHGILFLGTQSASLLLLLSDNLVVAHRLGAAQVGVFAIPMRLVGIIAIVPSFIVVPLWAAFGEAEARGDYSWIRKMLRSSNLTTGGMALAISLLLLLSGQMIIHHWVGREITISNGLIGGLTLAAFLVSANATNAIFLLGTGRLQIDLILVTAMLIVSIGLKVCLLQRFGLASIGWFTSIAQLLCINLPTWLYVRHVTRTYQDSPLPRRSEFERTAS